MTIKVKLTGTAVSVHPMNYPVNNGNHTVNWGPHQDTDTFTFDDPAITFDDANAPISGVTASGDTASGTDANGNNGSQDADYTYHVHLIDAGGNKITYPTTSPKTTDGDPTIKNRPN